MLPNEGIPDWGGSTCSVDGKNRRGSPLGSWEDRVKEYVSERGVRGNGLEWARRDMNDQGVIAGDQEEI